MKKKTDMYFCNCNYCCYYWCNDLFLQEVLINGALEGLEKIATRNQMTLSQLSLAWLRQKAPTSIVSMMNVVNH